MTPDAIQVAPGKESTLLEEVAWYDDTILTANPELSWGLRILSIKMIVLWLLLKFISNPGQLLDICAIGSSKGVASWNLAPKQQPWDSSDMMFHKRENAIHALLFILY